MLHAGNIGYYATVALVGAIISIGFARSMFRDDRGMSASQWLLAIMLWCIVMVFAWMYERWF